MLKCPFCKKEMAKPVNMDTMSIISGRVIKNGYRVVCSKCYAQGPKRSTKKLAEKAWLRSLIGEREEREAAALAKLQGKHAISDYPELREMNVLLALAEKNLAILIEDDKFSVATRTV